MTKIISMCLLGFCMGVFFPGCDNSTDPDPEKLSFDNPTGGETFVIGDTVVIKFKADAEHVSSVGVQITSDNGINYFSIVKEALAVSGSGVQSKTVQWRVGSEFEYDSLLYPNKPFTAGQTPSWQCIIQIYDSNDPNTNTSTDAFTVAHEKPYILRYPIGGEEYLYTDTIPIIYMYRTDMMSVIQRYFFALDSTNDWSQFTTYAPAQPQGSYKCTTAKKYFIPSDPNLLNAVGDSTKIMINDYALDRPVESGWIKINK